MLGWETSVSKRTLITYIDNINIKEDHMGIKKLHLNKRDNSAFTQNVSAICDQNIEKMLILTVYTEIYDEYWFIRRKFKRYDKNPVILTSSSSSFQNSCAIGAGLSDFHKMTITVMKTTFQKLICNHSQKIWD